MFEPQVAMTTHLWTHSLFTVVWWYNAPEIIMLYTNANFKNVSTYMLSFMLLEISDHEFYIFSMAQ